MSDDADRADVERESYLSDLIRGVRRRAELEQGQPGECELCGEWSGRLLRFVCAPCRDRYRLP